MNIPTDDSPELITATLHHIEASDYARSDDGDAILAEPTGASVTGYAYRRNPNRNRMESPPGTATVQTQVIFSIIDTATAVAKGDVVYLPACRLTAGVANVRASIQQVRSYPDSLQCDLEFGAQAVDET